MAGEFRAATLYECTIVIRRKLDGNDLIQMFPIPSQAYFGRTFDVYTRLWKFQQQHRQLLDIKYGLKVR